MGVRVGLGFKEIVVEIKINAKQIAPRNTYFYAYNYIHTSLSEPE